MKPFNKVGVGGTFDHLHEGHEQLLRMAQKMGSRISIGVTSDAMISYKKYSEYIQSYSMRFNGVVNFLKTLEKDVTSASFSELHNPYDIEDDLDALIVSEETYENAVKLNKMTGNKMVIIVIPIVKDFHGGKISSTRIRRSQIYPEPV